jgi:hypothetical protein
VASGLHQALRAAVEPLDAKQLERIETTLNGSGLGLLLQALRLVRYGERSALHAMAFDWFAEQGVKQPLRFARMLVPHPGA